MTLVTNSRFPVPSSDLQMRRHEVEGTVWRKCFQLDKELKGGHDTPRVLVIYFFRSYITSKIFGCLDELGTRGRETVGAIIRRSNSVVESNARMEEDFIQESNHDSLSAQDASAVEESKVDEAGFEGPGYVWHQ